MTTFINLNREKQTHFEFNKKGKYILFLSNISGEFTFVLKEKEIDLDIFGVFSGKNNDNFIVKTKQIHEAPNSKSNLLIKGIFDDNSVFHYEGLIKIEKEGQGSHAYQKNQNILLSPSVFVKSEPFLEILANEVFCTHGSTTGRLNAEELYYLISRGVSPKKAERLLLSGFLKEVLQKVEPFHARAPFKLYA